MDRKRMHQLFDTGPELWGSFDDFPSLPPGTDPMPHMSRNTISQPFYLVSDQDQTLINLSGEGEIWFQGERPERLSLVAGDSVYLPAGIPSRVMTHSPSLQVRFKAETPGREATVWYYANCEAIIHLQDVDTASQIPQQAYWDAAQAFNSDEASRTCAECATVHPPVDLGDIAWPTVAEAIQAAIAAD